MSHAGEDKWALAQFSGPGYAVELGALDGTYISNTLLLEQSGWTCLCIEPNPKHHQKLAETRNLVLRCACDAEPRELLTLYVMGNSSMFTHSTIRPDSAIGGFSTYQTTVLTLNQCLMLSGFPRLDLLSLDVDGIERDIMRGFDLSRWAPKVVIIEESNPNDMLDILPGYRHEVRLGNNGCYLREAA